MSDTELYARLALGDEDAFADLFAALDPSLARVATAITGNRAIAEEVTQETWMAVIAGIDKFEGKASLKNWIFAILSNKARTRARREGRTQSLDLPPEGDDADLPAHAFRPNGSWAEPPALWDEITPERTLAGREAWRIVTAAITTLPATQQAILDLMQGEKIPASEVAMILGLSEGNVRVHLHRARERIRRVLDQAQEK